MYNDLKQITEELYSFAQYLQINENDIPTILGLKKEVLTEIIEGKVPSHAAVKAISVLHSILESEIENDVIGLYTDLYGEEED